MNIIDHVNIVNKDFMLKVLANKESEIEKMINKTLYMKILFKILLFF